MRHLRLSLLVSLFLLLSGTLHADVILTDEKAEELNLTLDQLETTLKMQDNEIATLKLQNEELQTSSENKQKLLNEQTEELKNLNSSLKKRNLFSLVHDILISLGMGLIGLFIGIVFF